MKTQQTVRNGHIKWYERVFLMAKLFYVLIRAKGFVCIAIQDTKKVSNTHITVTASVQSFGFDEMSTIEILTESLDTIISNKEHAPKRISDDQLNSIPKNFLQNLNIDSSHFN